MDTLSLRKYNRQGSVIDSDIVSLKLLSKLKRQPLGNTTLTDKGVIKSNGEFLEFFINDHPLSKLLDKFYENKGSILDTWIGALGSFINKKAEIIR